MDGGPGSCHFPLSFGRQLSLPFLCVSCQVSVSPNMEKEESARKIMTLSKCDVKEQSAEREKDQEQSGEN